MTESLTYLKQIEEYEKIDPQKQRELLKKWQEQGCEQSLLAVYKSIAKYIPTIASQLKSSKDQMFMDLVQEGNIELWKTLSNFDLSKGSVSPFSYGIKYTKRCMIKYILKNKNIVATRLNKYTRAIWKYSPKTLSDLEVISSKEKLNLKTLTLHYEAVNIAYEEYREVNSKKRSTEDCIIDKEMATLAWKNIEKNKHKEIIYEKIFKDKTYQELQEDIGCTRQRIHQIYKKEIEKTRKALATEEMKRVNK